MASHNYFTVFLSLLLLFITIPYQSFAMPRILSLVKPKPLVLKYRKGMLLKGNVNVNLIWYGKFTTTQRTIIVDYLQSVSPKKVRSPQPPSVASWWRTTENYQDGPSIIRLGKQVLLPNYPVGKSLNTSHIEALAFKFHKVGTINAVLTASDVAVEDFCMNRCGSHGWMRGKKGMKFAYMWVGNSAVQCPGQCAWPFAKPLFGPQIPPLVAPNGDIGADGMVINLATVLAGTVTNPFDKGYFMGTPSLPLEAVSACAGIFGSGAFPGFPGRVLMDKVSGGSYNARGLNGRKYLLPAMWDPKTSTCKTLV